MPVYKDSRYADTVYTSVLGKDQVSRKWLHPRDVLTQEDVDQDWALHTTKVGDDLDLLAYKYTGDNPRKSKLWWLIADVNNLLWPLDVDPGTDLIIPTKLLSTKGK